MTRQNAPQSSVFLRTPRSTTRYNQRIDVKLFEMSDELIELVRKYEVLYNPKCKEYKDHLIRTAAWEEIAQKLSEPVEKCKDNWTKLRNSYASAIKRRKNKTSGQAASQMPAWKFEEQMNFLRPHMKSRSTKTKLTAPAPESPQDPFPDSPSDFFSSDSQSSSSSHHSHTPSYSDGPKRTSTMKRRLSANNKPDIQEIYDLMKSSNDLKKERLQSWLDMDETDLFFLSMSKAVKALPKLDQTKIKLDLHTAVSQAEIRELTETESILETPLRP